MRINGSYSEQKSNVIASDAPLAINVALTVRFCRYHLEEGETLSSDIGPQQRGEFAQNQESLVCL